MPPALRRPVQIRIEQSGGEVTGKQASMQCKQGVGYPDGPCLATPRLAFPLLSSPEMGGREVKRKREAVHGTAGTELQGRDTASIMYAMCPAPNCQTACDDGSCIYLPTYLPPIACVRACLSEISMGVRLMMVMGARGSHAAWDDRTT